MEPSFPLRPRPLPMTAPKYALEFRKMLRRSLLLNASEHEAFERLPNEIFEGLCRHNFNGNLALAERVLFNRYSDVERMDRGRLEQEKMGIRNLAKAARLLVKTLMAGEDVLFVTDNDNDGSLSQSILIEFIKAMPSQFHAQIHVEYAQPIGAERGLTVDVVNKATAARGWAPDHVFTVVTADNGINNRAEQEKIQARYAHSKLVITDHHLPDEAKVVLENERTVIFNPKYRPTDYFKRKNISGANTLGVLVSAVFRECQGEVEPGVPLTPAQKQALANIDEIGLWANLLDYANADIADMPNRPYTIEKALKLRPLMNVSTSMSNLVTGTFEDSAIDEIAAVSNGLSAEWMREKVAEIQTLNRLSQKLLSLYHRTMESDASGDDPVGEKTKADYFEALSEEVARSLSDTHYESINPNYIEQLRPIIFNISAIDNKPLFMALLSDTMVQVFEHLRVQEREILEQLRGVGLLRQDRRPSSTILYPVHPSVTKLFNRRLLGKAYNQDNNGFLLILSSIEGTEAVGSMRSLYPISDILAGKEGVEKRLGIAVEFRGHEMAAGFFIRSTNGKPLDEGRLSRFNAWLDERLFELKAEERVNQIAHVSIDFASVGLVTKINAAVKANLAGMWGLPAILQLSPNAEDEVWVTDAATTRQVSLSEIVATKRFGYQAIRTSFDGDAIVVPVELLRAVVESGYTKALRLSYMDDGVFMAHQVVDPDAMPRLVSLAMGRTDQKDLADYYAQNHKNTPFVSLSRENLSSSPYFRYNRYGAQEFDRWESTIVRLLDETDQDVLAVVDTEGTGLGKAPKCFNIGGTCLKIAKGSGTVLPAADFEERYFRNEKGEEFLLTSAQVDSLLPLSEGDEEWAPGTVVLHRTSLNRGVFYDERFVFTGTVEDLESVSNLKELGPDVIYNRRLDGFAFAFLINDPDFAITQEFEDLTGISTAMVRQMGIPAAEADRQIVEYFRALRREDGSPARVIFQAHNMPYDRGVILANFQQLLALMNENLTSDTAKCARQFKLAYDDTPVSSFSELDGIPAKSYFYDSPYSDYSLSTFLDRVEQGKGGVFPDTKAQLLLRYRPEIDEFSLIDRRANREFTLPYKLADLRNHKTEDQLPDNAVKFSVERLSSRAMIRNIMLLDKPSPIKVPLLDHEKSHRAALELFQEKYHFDLTADANIDHFIASLFQNDRAAQLLGDVGKDGLTELAERFLEANRALQARFHDGWIYEKVLGLIEPDAKTLRIPESVIEQVNYLTDLPNSKIREVFEATIRFKRHFGIDHALVHEEHNNIRQVSEDGQGLSDTAYEAVLPQMLGMLKFYNPYYQSERTVVRQLIDANIKGSMTQTMLHERYGGDLARDSYSMTQMMAFDRDDVTETVARARALASAPAPGTPLPEIKFRLPGEILLDNSAIYGVPKRHLSQEEIRGVAEDLTQIVVTEQLKTSVTLSSNIGVNDSKRLMAIAEASDADVCRRRDRILDLFESISFERRNAGLKKLSEEVRLVLDGVPVKIGRGMVVTDELVSAAETMIAEFSDIYHRIGCPVPDREPAEFLAALRKKAEKGKKKEPTRSPTDVTPSDDGAEEEDEEIGSGVRLPNFLPTLDIGRREPLNFVLKHHGISVLLPYVRKQIDEAVPAAPALEVQTEKRARRKP